MGLTFPILLDRKIEIAPRHQGVNLLVSFFMDPSGMIKTRVFWWILVGILSELSSIDFRERKNRE